MLTPQKQTGTTEFLLKCIDFYEEMQREIALCKTEIETEEEWIQACFEIASASKEKVCEAVRNFIFSNKTEEIFFFKNIKPLFSAEVEFYVYCYQVILFRTKEIEADKNELEDFYRRQLLRKEKMQRENPAFCEYIREQKTDADQQWFTRAVQSRDSSLFDSLKGRYMAIEKFEEYLKDVMNRTS